MKRYPESSAGHITGRILLKKLVPLFAALLLAGCGEKSSSEGSDSAGASAEPPADAAKKAPTDSPGKEPSPSSLSDADIERLLKEAVDSESLPERDGLIYHDDKPYSGWGKDRYDSGQVRWLGRFEDGEEDGLHTLWHENGQKMTEGTSKDGELNSWTSWHENGQKMTEGVWKDDGLISEKFWNNKGEEVETQAEAFN